MSQEVLKALCQPLPPASTLSIASPLTAPRRACVAAVLRWRRGRTDIPVTKAETVEAFFELPWVKDDDKGEAELLFMLRATRAGDRWSGHVAFPGGKNEADETDEDTVTREVLEEIGIDLRSEDYICIGTLPSQEITSVFNKQLLMILVPFVFLQVVPDVSFALQASEVAAVQWVPISFFLSPSTVDQFMTQPLAATRSTRQKSLSPMRHMFGSVTFPSVDLPSDDPTRRFRLWGLTLGLTRDLIQRVSEGRPAWQVLAFIKHARRMPHYSHADLRWLMWILDKVHHTR
ncbi:hypothetical protein EC973_007511 [Apophysomyces ossiformis]|uniref:Nudix hydrolase domain-containing protein n=1 Tax=Apophysomyces ossiformis TaxID=679940 RepID=A0A8H7BM44_9FUNG|nr:hypothetical protein EC973_007511 [Apophysomyces ossiformis]